MKHNSLTLMKPVERGRRTLEKQNAWAESQMNKAILERVIIEERQYGSGGRELLDFIYPRKRDNNKLPVFIYVHGGGWTAGTKESRRLYCANFAAQGYFVANIEYDLAPEKTFPVQIGQCIQAVDYLLDAADDCNLDPDKIAVGGESAGAYYAAFLSAIAKDKSILGKLKLPPMSHPEFDVKANLFNCGAFDLTSLYKIHFPDLRISLQAYTGYAFEEIRDGRHDLELLQMSPLAYIQKNYPKTFMIYGCWDSIRFSTFRMINLFEKLGIQYKVFKGTGLFYGQHTTSMILKDQKAYRIFEEVINYIDSALNVKARVK